MRRVVLTSSKVNMQNSTKNKHSTLKHTKASIPIEAFFVLLFLITGKKNRFQTDVNSVKKRLLLKTRKVL